MTFITSKNCEVNKVGQVNKMEEMKSEIESLKKKDPLSVGGSFGDVSYIF